MNAQHHGLWLLSVETLLHNLCPYAAGSTELGNLLQNVVVSVPEEGQTAGKIIDVQAGLDSSLAVCNTISNGKCDFLGSSGTSLTDMVAGDGNSIPLRYILGAILKDVGNQTHGRTWREDISTTCSVLLQNIVLNSTLQLVCRHAMYIASSTEAGALMVMEVETLPRSIWSKRISISARESIATPTLPTSPSEIGSSES